MGEGREGDVMVKESQCWRARFCRVRGERVRGERVRGARMTWDRVSCISLFIHNVSCIIRIM